MNASLPTLAKSWDGDVPNVPDYPENESGRRGRGELEAICEMIVKRWMVEGDDRTEFCSAEYLAKEATRYDGRSTTSAATARVLDRWVSVGFATVARSPIRFVALTPSGVMLGLDELKRLHGVKRKREKREAEVRAYNEKVARRKRTK